MRHCVECFTEIQKYSTHISTRVDQIMPVIGGVKKGSFSSGCQDQPLENEPWE